MTQTQIQRQHSERKQDEAPSETKPAEKSKGDKLKAEIDAILDDIEEVLNEESVEWSSFVQKGGE